jgi:hypothetical protein
MQDEFISEPIKPVGGTFDSAGGCANSIRRHSLLSL